MSYEICINSKYKYQISDIEIADEIFDRELFDYQIRNREDLIDDLIDWITEARESDKYLMKEDLKYLMSLTDEYVFSNILTNEYIAKSDNEEEFNKICFDLLELNNEVE